MAEDRWPRICFLEELRSASNGRPSKWAKAISQTLREGGAGDAMDMLWLDPEHSEGVEEILEVHDRLKEQERARDRAQATQSTYCKYYLDWERGAKIRVNTGGGETKEVEYFYWEDKELAGRYKEQWARLRCGNITREGKKGFTEQCCRICRAVPESLDHIWCCGEAHRLMEAKWVSPVEEWKRGESGEELLGRIKECLRNKPMKFLCDYAWRFEKLAKDMSDNRTTEALRLTGEDRRQVSTQSPTND